MKNKIIDLETENIILKQILNEIRELTNCPNRVNILEHIKNVKQENNYRN
jgi:hypothetical protein